MNRHHNQEKKVLFLCKKRLTEYGVSIGLVNSAAFIANYLRDKGIPTKVVAVTDANSIDKEVYDYKPSHVIIHAIWVPPYKMEELVKKYPQVQWNIRIHSKIPFLAHEGIAIPWISEYGEIMDSFKNLGLSGNSTEFADAIQKSMKIPTYYLPNLYYPQYSLPNRNPIHDSYVNIGCFGAVRPFKNHLLQAMAAIYFGDAIRKPIRFHINGGRHEQGGQEVMKNLKALFDDAYPHELVNHEWRTHQEFLELVASMNIGMQVSISETYNIVAADFISIGVPLVGSGEIYWLPTFRQADPMDIDSIADHLKSAYDCDNFLTRFICNHKLKTDTKSAGKKWLKFLDGKLPYYRDYGCKEQNDEDDEELMYNISDEKLSGENEKGIDKSKQVHVSGSKA